MFSKRLLSRLRITPSLLSVRRSSTQPAGSHAHPQHTHGQFHAPKGHVASGHESLHARLSELVPIMREDLKQLKAKHGNKSLGDVTVGMALGGMRDIKGLVCETSLLDANEGIRFRGYSIPECQNLLPKEKDGEQPKPEGLFWLLLTGEIPSAEQVTKLGEDLKVRAKGFPESARKIVDALPKEMHPMTALVAGVSALQTQSKFAKAYERGINKNAYWEPTLEDSLDLIARLPELASRIYRNKYHGGKIIAPDYNLDYSANFAHMLGFNSPKFYELMRLYLTIHADHEGGNVSAHATHLVGSALSDPYLSYAAGMCGLAGPLHGLANQEVLRWLESFRKRMGNKPLTRDAIVEECWSVLNSGQVIPGYGHAVLRKTDPRFTCQAEFAKKHIPPTDEWVKLVTELYAVVPDILTKHGKTKNPWPNVDAHSGVLLQHFGLTQADYYTVLFGVSRGLGVLASLTVDRVLGFPLERPKSLTTQWLWEKYGKH